jgi:hypothetical protein
MDEGEIEVDSIEPIGLPDITPQLARESGFLGVLDLLKIAKHGKGENIYLVRFHYIPGKSSSRLEAPSSVIGEKFNEGCAIHRCGLQPCRSTSTGFVCTTARAGK